MFNKDITKEMVAGNYTGGEALFEILILVVVAFILGWVTKRFWDQFVFEKNVIYVGEKDFVEKKMEKKIKKKKKDNLRLIEGIGPKIESLLEREGIDSFKKLSTTETKQLQDILKNAGDRYAFHNPTTWSEQAMLAYAGKWDELEEFQDFLKGGKTV